MLWTYKAPDTTPTVEVMLGRTVASLLDDACDMSPNDQAFQQWTEAGWTSISNQLFRARATSVGLGLLSLGLEKGDRVALLMHSDLHFCLTDLGCLIANLVDVPIDLTQTLEHIIYVLQHSGSKTLVLSNLDLLAQIISYLPIVTRLQSVIVVDVPPDWQSVRSQWLDTLSKPTSMDNAEAIPESACLSLPSLLHSGLHSGSSSDSHGLLPTCIQLFSLEEVQQRGQIPDAPMQLQQLRTTLQPHDLATIVYIPDDTGHPQGVMLTHENLSANALTSFAELSGLKRGNQETVLSFLPLNHVFARVLLYGHIQYGHTIYFTSPSRLIRHLKDVQPTILITVPLLLEKIHGKILERGNQATSRIQQMIFGWALMLTRQYECGKQQGKRYALMLKLADRFVFSKWRSVFGNRLKYLICGGAALKAEFVNQFGAAGITVLQGYGLTQTSAVVCFNRKLANRAGTVGKPIAGVELKLAEDGEILVRSPYVMKGYYQNPDATREVLDPQGWLHTGDLGQFTEDGFLQITGLKKALFKLSTGKYIAPQPIEDRLMQSRYVEQAIVVGAEQKFCGALIVPNLSALQEYGLENGIDIQLDGQLNHPCITALYQSVVDAGNCHLPYWATIKRFRLLHQAVIAEGAIANPSLYRAHMVRQLALEIAALYDDALVQRAKNQIAALDLTVIQCPTLVPSHCPAFAQSLNPRLTTS